MLVRILFLFFINYSCVAVEVSGFNLSLSVKEQQQGVAFLRSIWNTEDVNKNIEMQVYIKKLGLELAESSPNPNKHFDFLLIDNNSINAFAGPYGYIGIYTGILTASDTEAEMAGVLAHEIAHVSQNHLNRFSEKTNKYGYLILAGILAASLLDNDSDSAQAVLSSATAGVMQSSVNFIRGHEWEADRIGANILAKVNFNPGDMSNFFKKIKDTKDAQEFLSTHPLSANRIADRAVITASKANNYRKDSFSYLTIKARLYYDNFDNIKEQNNQALSYYMLAYKQFKKQNYKLAQKQINKLLKINTSKPSNILAARIATKLGDTDLSRQYLNKNGKKDEPSIYYKSKSYAKDKKYKLAISTLKYFLRKNTGTVESYNLLSALYIKNYQLDRSHIANAKGFVLQGKLEDAIYQYKRAKNITNNNDLYDVIDVRLKKLERLADLYKAIS